MSALAFALPWALAAGGVAAATARSADGAKVRYQAQGRGETTLVLVHGWAFDRHLWDGLLPRLTGRHRVLTLDLAGHGKSGAGRAAWTMEGFGSDVRAVVEAADARQVVLVGHSMGGPVVLEAARQMPQRLKGVILVDTLLDFERRVPQSEIEDMAGRLLADYQATAALFVNQYLFVPATPASVRARVLAQAAALPPQRSVAMLRQTWAYDPLPALGEIEAPIRAVNSDHFPTNLEANRRHAPGYGAVIVHGTGHYPMLEEPERFGQAFEQALAQVLAHN